jgi:hypothetical protein
VGYLGGERGDLEPVSGRGKRTAACHFEMPVTLSLSSESLSIVVGLYALLG